MQFIKKVPITKAIKKIDFNPQLIPEDKREKFMLSSFGVKNVLSSITTFYLLGQKREHKNYKTNLLTISKSTLPYILATKNFVYNLIDTVDLFKDICENILSNRSMSAKNMLYHKDLHFFVTEFLLDELNLIRRFESGKYYLHFYSNLFFKDLSTSQVAQIGDSFRGLSSVQASILVDKELEKSQFVSKLSLVNKVLMREIFKYKFNKKLVSNDVLYNICYFTQKRSFEVIGEHKFLKNASLEIAQSLGMDRGKDNELDNGPELTL